MIPLKCLQAILLIIAEKQRDTTVKRGDQIIPHNLPQVSSLQEGYVLG